MRATLKGSRRDKRNSDTNVFLTSLNGPLTFGELLSSLRQVDEIGLAAFATTLGISRQHLHQLEIGQKECRRYGQYGLRDCSDKAKAIFVNSRCRIWQTTSESQRMFRSKWRSEVEGKGKLRL